MAKGKRTTDRRQNKDIKVLKKKVKALEAPIERKFLDTAHTGVVGTAGLSIEGYLLNDVEPMAADGTVATTNKAMSQRLGKSIHMNRIRLKGFVEIEADLAGSGPAFVPQYGDYLGRARVMVVRWPQNDLANSSSPKDFLTPAGYPTSYPVADTFIDGYKLKFPENRYEVIYDRTHNLQSAGQQAVSSLAAGTVTDVTAVYPCRAKVDVDIKLNHDADWAVVESASGCPSQNALMLYVICGNGTIEEGAQKYNVLINSRLNYTDM